jgi:hypothetical protein
MTSKQLLLVGALTVVLASFINGVLVTYNVGGIAREGMRVIILIGIGILAFGIIRRSSKK